MGLRNHLICKISDACSIVISRNLLRYSEILWRFIWTIWSKWFTLDQESSQLLVHTCITNSISHLLPFELLTSDSCKQLMALPFCQFPTLFCSISNLVLAFVNFQHFSLLMIIFFFLLLSIPRFLFVLPISLLAMVVNMIWNWRTHFLDHLFADWGMLGYGCILNLSIYWYSVLPVLTILILTCLPEGCCPWGLCIQSCPCKWEGLRQGC